MKVLVTGSHFSPAQALIEKLKNVEDIEIIYLGRKHIREGDIAKSAESQILPKLGVKFIPIITGRLNRFFSFGTVISLLKTPIGFIQAFYYLLKEQPEVIVSFGGYTGLPVVICGYILSVPSIIHEQSLKLGLANLLSAFFAKKIAVSFENLTVPSIFKNKTIVTGNPIRKEFLGTKTNPSSEIKKFISSIKSDKPLVLITAGNQGSHKINLLVEDKLVELTKEIALIHQTGDSKFDDFSNLRKYQSKSYLVKKWIDAADLNYILDNADLAISRAGINTLIELSLKSVPSLIIPIPVGSEQKTNAKFFANIGLGEYLLEGDLTPDKFIAKLKQLLIRKKQYKESAQKVKNRIIMNAEKRLVQEILLINNLYRYRIKF